MNTQIPLPKLLDADLKEARRITPVNVSISEKIKPLSIATITLKENEDIPARSYFKLYTRNGESGIYRVKTRPKSYGGSGVSIELEHAATEMGDYLVREKVESEMTVSQAFTRLFSHYRGELWQLGTISFTDTVLLEAEYTPVLEAMLTVLEQVPQYYMTFDFSTTPWTLGLAQRTTVVSAEGRLGRNVTNATVTPDDSELYTRVYMKGLPLQVGQTSTEHGYIEADTIAVYGVIEKDLDSDDSYSTAQKQRIANIYLEKHKNPILAISISGADFSLITGETLDKLALGKLYRLAVPKYNTTVEEIITGLTWPNVYGSDQVTVELADEGDPVVEYMRNQAKSAKKTKKLAKAVATACSDIRKDFYSEDGYLHSYVEITASHLRTEFGDAVSNLAYSVIEQTSTYIHMEVANAASSISHTVIEQTSEYVRTEVSAIASGVAWSVIEQTMTNIVSQVERKSKIYAQWEDPNNGTNVLRDGDIWIKTNHVRTWSQAGGMTWDQASSYKWRDYLGAVQYVWKNGAWEKTNDEPQTVINSVKIEQTEDSYAIVGKQVELLGEEYRSNLTVTAQKISSDVSTSKSQIYSSIAQTATNIRMHVENVKEGLQSTIEQTASQIRLSVSASKSDLYSSITQTASSIRLEVANAVSGLQSSITQTASEIRLEVSASTSTIYSSISQTASQIRLEVENTASGLRSSITQNANRIELVVDADGIKPASIVAAINDGSSSIIISANHIDLDGYVKATDLTTTWLSAKIAAISSLSGQTFSLDSCYAGTFKFRSSAGAGYTYTDFKDLFVTSINISQSGDTYTLTANNANAQAVSTVTFSRATSLSAGWDGNRKFTVSASPQGVSRYTEIRSSVPNAKASWSNRVGTLTIEATIDGGETFVDVGEVTVNAPTDQGNNAGNVSLGSAEATTSRPSGTELASWRTTINNAISGRKYFRFKATLSNGTGEKWYYINFE